MNAVKSEKDLLGTTSTPTTIEDEAGRAILSQEKHKGPGPDGINNESLILASSSVLPVLTEIFHEILTK